MVDGSLNFDTKIDTNGMEKGIESVKDIMKQLINSIERLTTTMSNAFNGVSTVETVVEMQKVEAKVEETTVAIEEMAQETVEATTEMAQSTDIAVDNMEELEIQVESTTQAVDKMAEEMSVTAQEVLELDDEPLEEMNTTAQELRNTLEFIKQTFYAIPEILSMVGSRFANVFAKGEAEVEEVTNEIIELVDMIDTYKDALRSMEAQGKYFGDEDYDKAYGELVRMDQKLRDYKKNLVVVGNEQDDLSKKTDKATKSLKKQGKESDKGAKKMSRLGKTLSMLGKSLGFSIVFQAFTTVTRSIAEGFQNLAQFSPGVNRSLSTLATSLQTLKNSFATAFAPILTVVTPILQTLINHISNALSVMGQFFAVMLTGATTFTRAKDAQIDYAKSLKKTKDEANGSVSSIDKLNMVNDGGSASADGTPSVGQMFEEVEIDSGIIKVVDDLKTKLEPLVSLVGEALTNGFNSFVDALKRLSTWISDNKEGLIVAAGLFLSFFAAFKIVGLVQAILPFITMLGTMVSSGALASGIMTALGTALGFLTAPATIIATILGLLIYTFVDLYKNSESFRTAIAELGASWKQALEPLADFVGTVLSDAWNKILKPIINFFVETMIPNLITTFKNLWQKVLVPLGKFIATVLEPVFKILSDILMMIWKKVVLPLAQAIGSVFKTAWDGLYKILNKTVIPILDKVISVLTKLWKNVINPIISVLWDNLKPAFDTVFSAIGGVINGLKTTMEGIIKFITGVFTGDWETAWQGVQDIFKGIFDAFVNIVKTPMNLIIDIINGMIGAVTTGINTVINGLNKFSINIPDNALTGAINFGLNLKTLTAPKIPKLATGTVVPANFGEFQAILGDNKREPEIVSPLSTMEQAMENVLRRIGGGQEIIVQCILDRKIIFESVVSQNEIEKQRTGKSKLA